MARKGFRNCDRLSTKTPMVATLSIFWIGFISLATATLGLVANDVAFAQQEEQLVERVVAVVQGRPILLSEVREKAAEGSPINVSEYPATESATPFEKALQDAINTALIIEKARELNYDIDPEQVETEITKFLEQRNLTRDSLLKFLREQGKTLEEYKENFKERMIISRFQGVIIQPQIKITDRDIESYFLKKSGGHSDLAVLDLRQLVIKIPSDASADVKKVKQDLAREVHAKLSSGMAFAEAVKIYSDDPAAREKGGLISGVQLKDLSASIKSHVEGLEPGKFTAPIDTPQGIQLFYVESRKVLGSSSFKQQKKALESELYAAEFHNALRRWLSDQRQRAQITINKD